MGVSELQEGTLLLGGPSQALGVLSPHCTRGGRGGPGPPGLGLSQAPEWKNHFMGKTNRKHWGFSHSLGTRQESLGNGTSPATAPVFKPDATLGPHLTPGGCFWITLEGPGGQAPAWLSLELARHGETETPPPRVPPAAVARGSEHFLVRVSQPLGQLTLSWGLSVRYRASTQRAVTYLRRGQWGGTVSITARLGLLRRWAGNTQRPSPRAAGRRVPPGASGTVDARVSRAPPDGTAPALGQRVRAEMLLW